MSWKTYEKTSVRQICKILIFRKSAHIKNSLLLAAVCDTRVEGTSFIYVRFANLI